MSIAYSTLSIAQYAAMSLADYDSWLIDPIIAGGTTIYSVEQADTFRPGARAADVYRPTLESDTYLPGAQNSQ